jgi:hypothetical protein
MFQLNTDEVPSQSDIKKVVFEARNVSMSCRFAIMADGKSMKNGPSFCLDLPFYVHQNK